MRRTFCLGISCIIRRTNLLISLCRQAMDAARMAWMGDGIAEALEHLSAGLIALMASCALLGEKDLNMAV